MLSVIAVQDSGELADAAVGAKALAFAQGDAVVLQCRVVAQVVQDGAGFDCRQLVGVAEEDEAGIGGGRGDERMRQFEREHGGFVDDDEVVRQMAAHVVARLAVRADAEQAVQGLRWQVLDARCGEAFFHAFCRFAGGCGECDADFGVGLLFGMDEAGDGVGFAGAGAAVDEGEATAAREANGVLLFCAQAVCGDGFGGGVGGVQALAEHRGKTRFLLVVTADPEAVATAGERCGAVVVGEERGGGEGVGGGALRVIKLDEGVAVVVCVLQGGQEVGKDGAMFGAAALPGEVVGEVVHGVFRVQAASWPRMRSSPAMNSGG